MGAGEDLPRLAADENVHDFQRREERALLAPVSAANCLMLIVFDRLTEWGISATLYHKLIKLATLRTIKGQRNRVDARGLECG